MIHIMIMKYISESTEIHHAKKKTCESKIAVTHHETKPSYAAEAHSRRA